MTALAIPESFGLLPAAAPPASPTPTTSAPVQATVNPFTAGELDTAWADWSSRSPVLADVLLVLARTGLRWSEARAVAVADAGDDSLRVDKAASEGAPTRPLPSGRVREVPLAQRIRPIVARLAAGRDPDELLFTTGLGGQLHRAATLRRLDWPTTGRGRRLDDLRHTAALLWLAEGFDAATLRGWMGPSPLLR
jgi:integrase